MSDRARSPRPRGRRGPAHPGAGGPAAAAAMGGHARREVDGLQGLGKRLLRPLRPERGAAASPRWARSRQRCRVRRAARSSATPPTSSSPASIGRQLPAGITKDQAVDELRAQGQDTLADMLSRDGRRPRPGHRLRRASGTCCCASLGDLRWRPRCSPGVQGTAHHRVVQRTVVPAARGRRGEAVPAAADATSTSSRAARCSAGPPTTSTTSRRPAADAQPADHLAADHRRRAGDDVLDLAAAGADRAGHRAGVGAGRRRRSASGRSRSSSQQWTTTGQLNAHIEEMYTGHSLVKVFGRQQEVGGGLRRAERASCTRPSFQAQFISGLIQPAMMFIGNLNYVLVAVVGGLRVASGSLTLGDVQAFIQYSRQFSQPLTQVATMANLLQSGVASAERVFELLDAEERARRSRPTPLTRRRPRRGRVRERVVPLRAGQAADRGPVAGRRARARRSRSSARPAPARPRWSTC